jgi:hypothetical protein
MIAEEEIMMESSHIRPGEVKIQRLIRSLVMVAIFLPMLFWKCYSWWLVVAAVFWSLSYFPETRRLSWTVLVVSVAMTILAFFFV